MTERRPIRVMPPELAQKIAAGEVVERPASAVKELIDNALDAGANRITVEIQDAGLKLIRVADNGRGIPSDQLPLAFASHATSKIGDSADLEAITTLGFRGEALASIAAVSRVEVQSRAAEEAVGSSLAVEFGAPGEVTARSVPVGTRLAVRDLFANVPARRKFVRSLRAEANQINAVVTQYALARPEVQLTLVIDGRGVFSSPGSGQVRDVVAAVYGADVVEHICPVDYGEDGVLVRGIASTPQLSRQNRSALHLSVNGRPVQNRSLGFALEEAYSGFLMSGRHPLAVVDLRLPAPEVDANIHPAKSEVRFAREREVHGALHRAVSEALLQTRLQACELSTLDDESIGAMPVLVGEGAEPGLPLDLPVEPDAPPPLLPSVPVLRVVGQTSQMFIVAEGPDGLYMIDQHAAHERVLFDQLDQQLSDGGAISQPLLEPVSVDLSAAQMQALEQNRPLLLDAGFELEPFGHGACLIRAVPVLARSGSPAELVAEVLGELESLPGPAAARERALAAMACKGAVKAGQALDLQEMRQLVELLERTARPATCPHGRPTMLHLSHSRLEREFGRK